MGLRNIRVGITVSEVEVEHLLEFLHLQVEDVALGGYYGAGHVPAGGVEQGVHPPVLRDDAVAVLLYGFLAHYVGLHKLGPAAVNGNVVDNLPAYALFPAEDDHPRAVQGEVFCYRAAEHARAAGDYNDVIIDVE